MKQRRPVLRFGASTLLLIVAIASAWAGWNLWTVQERTTMLAQIESCGGECRSLVVERMFGSRSMHLDARASQIPFMRRLLHDRTIDEIDLPENFDGIEQVKRIFPEADVHEYGTFPRYH